MHCGNSENKKKLWKSSREYIQFSHKAFEIPCRLSDEISHIRRRIALSGAFCQLIESTSSTRLGIVASTSNGMQFNGWVVELFRYFNSSVNYKQNYLWSNCIRIPRWCRIAAIYFESDVIFLPSHFSASAQTKINTYHWTSSSIYWLASSASLEECVLSLWKRKKNPQLT